MKISILFPVKNAARWLPETLASILSQSHSQWELLAIDDHSSDNSLALLESAAQEDSRIQVSKNPGIGIIPALQFAYSQASGIFLTRMDADDIMPAERLKLLVEALNKLGKGYVVTGKVTYFPEPVSVGYQKYALWLNERVDQNDHSSHLFRECVLASPNWMIYRSDAEDFKLFDRLRYPEDYDLVFRMYAAGIAFRGIPETTLLWREHPDRTSRNSDIYQQASFFQLKLNWFFKLQTISAPLALFGAGSKGKIVARYLIAHSIDFCWYDVQYKKYSAGLLGQVIRSPEFASEHQAIVCVYPDETNVLEEFLAGHNLHIGENAWYF